MNQKDAKISALELIYSALKPLDAQAQQEVIASVFALLGTPGTMPHVIPHTTTVPEQSPVVHQPLSLISRPIGLAELAADKHPGTNAQRIALFAYWREKHEGLPRFSREDLRSYFEKAKLAPPKNYDRDFTKAVERGWLHEDATESYITTKGIEAVENGFEGERSYSRRSEKAKRTSHKRQTKKTMTKRQRVTKQR